MNKVKYLIGIDEAGRGPLAGPVSVGITMYQSHFDKKLLKGIKDSKKLNQNQREEWFAKIHLWKKEGMLDFYVCMISSKVIDKKGMSFAIKKAIQICLKKIKANPHISEVLLDGSLKAPPEFLRQKTIIKGDEKIPIISLASIAAKVTRDRHMIRISKKYGVYKFDIHKGYGTKMHRELIIAYGPCDIHRLSFLSNILPNVSDISL